MSDRLTAEQRALLRWGEARRRDLPWRRTRDPWAVLVSEVMLQQTQVDRALPRWEAFVARWPRPADLAASSLAEVLAAWSGLGYPRRARDLHRAAVEVVAEHGGEVPTDLDALEALPGIGPYTARAVLVFALEVDGIGIVDTNIARILARRAGERLTRRAAQDLADRWTPPGLTWAHHQALMDLGAARCRPRPDCDGCPIRRWCAWGGPGGAGADPAVGSAGVSTRQARFAGSDRQARGRLMAALLDGDLSAADLGRAAGIADDPGRASRVAESLRVDGLVEVVGERWRLAGRPDGGGVQTAPNTPDGSKSAASTGRPSR